MIPEEHSTPVETPEAGGSLFNQAALVYLVFSIIALGWIRFRDGKIRLELFIQVDQWWWDLLWGLGAALGLVLLWEIARRIWESPRRLEDHLRAMVGDLGAGEILSLALMSGFAEELLFRGAMQLSWGIVPATLLFGFLHSGRGKDFISWTVSALVAGSVLGLLLWWRGNLLASMVAHFVVNSINLRLLIERGRKRSPQLLK